MPDIVLGGNTVEVRGPVPPVFQIVKPSSTVLVMPVPGPAGPPGAAGSGFVHEQTTPASSVAIAHSFGRLPAVAVYIAGEQIETDVTVDTGHAYLSFPAPTVFTAVLT